LREVFLREPIEEIAFRNWQARRTILIGDNKLLERTLTRISKHNVHTLPVVNTPANSGQQSVGIVGTIDVLDIIHALIYAIDQSSQSSNQPNQPQNLNMPQKIRREFMNKPVSEFVSKNCFVVSTTASLWDAVKGFVETDQDRFLIVDRQVQGNVTKFSQPENDIDGVLTLSDVLKFLVANSMFMREEPMFSKTLKELGLGRTKPNTINHTAFAADAFRQMDRSSHDGLAVINDDGVLIGNLSACDLKGVTRQNCPILNTPVEDFLLRDQKREWFYRPLALDINDTLYHTIHQFASLGKQRFYFVDQQGRPIGEISRRDIICQVWKIIGQGGQGGHASQGHQGTSQHVSGQQGSYSGQQQGAYGQQGQQGTFSGQQQGAYSGQQGSYSGQQQGASQQGGYQQQNYS